MAGLRQTITRLRAPTINDNNSEVRDWAGELDEHPLEQALVQPAGTAEDLDRREARQSRYTVQLPDRTADVRGTDRIRLPGDPRQWAITGEPLWQPSLSGIGYLGFEITVWEG